LRGRTDGRGYGKRSAWFIEDLWFAIYSVLGILSTGLQAISRFRAGDEKTRHFWRTRARKKSAVGTLLNALGEEATGDLLDHAYVLAMVNRWGSGGWRLWTAAGEPPSVLEPSYEPPQAAVRSLLRLEVHTPSRCGAA
jgi:hypothetical protein